MQFDWQGGTVILDYPLMIFFTAAVMKSSFMDLVTLVS